jgi:hypothetical protein
MPLPAVSKALSEALTLLSTQRSELRRLEGLLKNLNQKADPELAALNKSKADAITEKVSVQELAEAKLRDARAINADVSVILQLTRELEKIKRDDSIQKRIDKLQDTIDFRVKNIDSTAERRNLNITIPALRVNIKRIEERLNNSTPVNVTASLVESSAPNKFLIALGSALEGAAETAKEKVSEALTPKDPTTKLQEDIDLLTKVNTVIQKAITSVEIWRAATVAYEKSNKEGKAAALSNVRSAYFNANLDCIIVNKYDLLEPSCLSLVEPPVSSE